MIRVFDQIGCPVVLESFPARIVSLVPSISEFIDYLGCDDKLVGCTKFCIYPKHLRQSSTIIGGTKNIHIDKILDLKPDLVLANKEENVREQVISIKEFTQVYTSDVKTIDDALQMNYDIGNLLGKTSAVNVLNEQIKQVAFFNHKIRFRTAYIIWNDPIMSIGGDTFIHSMLKANGWDNVFEESNRYPTTDFASLRSWALDCVMLSSEPFPFTEEHRKQFEVELPGVRIMLVDGSLISWYGNRMLEGISYLQNLRNSM